MSGQPVCDWMGRGFTDGTGRKEKEENLSSITINNVHNNNNVRWTDWFFVTIVAVAEENLSTHSNREEEDAAVKIQAYFRGYQTRRDLKDAELARAHAANPNQRQGKNKKQQLQPLGANEHLPPSPAPILASSPANNTIT